MEITVIIPSYKPQSYLWECLDSLKNQTFPKDRFEIYLILNGCCEPYKEDIETYIATDFGENFHLIQTDIAGVSNARNIGINLSKGEYITFLDDDDYVSPLFLEELYAKAANDTISICYPYAFIDGNTSQIFPYHLNSQFEKRAKQGKLHFLHAWKFFAGPWMKLIPRRIIGSRRFNLNYKNGEDGLFLFAISDRFKWITFTSEKAIYYRRYRTGSAMTSEKTFEQYALNELSLMKDYSLLYIKNIGSINLVFYTIRMLYKTKGLLNAVIGKFQKTSSKNAV